MSFSFVSLADGLRTPPTARADPSTSSGQGPLRGSKPCSVCAAVALCVSSACRRVRRVVAPAGESLSFVASNESNQSKDAEHQLIWASRFGYKGSACPRHALDKQHTCCDFFATRLAAHRRGQGMFAQQTTALLLGPVGGVEERRGLGPRATARFVH